MSYERDMGRRIARALCISVNDAKYEQMQRERNVCLTDSGASPADNG